MMIVILAPVITCKLLMLLVACSRGGLVILACVALGVLLLLVLLATTKYLVCWCVFLIKFGVMNGIVAVSWSNCVRGGGLAAGWPICDTQSG